MEFTTYLGLQLQATRLYREVLSDSIHHHRTGLSPSMGSGRFPAGLGWGMMRRAGPSETQHRSYLPHGIGKSLCAGLLPFQSPLLRESLLVSFPPLINMLKFGGLSLLTRGRRFGNYYYFLAHCITSRRIIIIISSSNQKTTRRETLLSSANLFPKTV